MTFAIYSIGDLNYLRAILESVAALVGTGIPTQLAAVGFVISMLVLSLQAVIGGGKMPQYQNLLVGWIIYGFMFGPGVTVQIHDAYSLNSASVDNVPFGIAAVGSIMSRVGHEITEEIEVGFSLPNMMTNGFGAPLERLLKARNLSLGPADFNVAGVNTTAHGSLMETTSNYVKDCTMAGIQLGTLNESAITSAANPWEAMKFTSEVYGTKTYIPDPAIDPPEGTNRTCTEAHSVITQYLASSNFWNGYNKQLQVLLGAQPEATMQSALDSLVGTGISAKQYMLSAIMRDAFEMGIQGSLVEGGDIGGVIVTTTAREQRNVQWAAESSLFMTVVRPMLTFFEGFFYSLTPFMAFLVVLVPMGLSLAGKYLVIAVWIQMWLPTMAILNFYINFVAQEKLSLLHSVGSITSINGLNMGAASLADWLATAGMLAASTPAITLVLVTGSAVAMTSLSSRLNGGDHINEKQLAPDAIDNKAIGSLASMKSWDLPGGSRTTGAERIAPTIDFGGGVSSSISSARSEADTARQGFTSDWSSHVQGSQTLQNQFSDARGLGRTISGSNSASAQTLQQMANSVGAGMKFDSAQMEKLQGTLAAGLMLGGTGGRLSSEFGETQGAQLLENFNRMKSSSEGKQMMAQFTDQVASEVKKGEASFYTDSVDTGTQKALGESAGKVLSAESSYREALQAEQHFGSNYSMNGIDMANQIVQNGHYSWMDAKINSLQGDGDQARVSNLTARYQDPKGYGLDYPQARTLAGLTVMNDKARMTGDQEAQNGLLDAAYKATGAQHISPDAQKGAKDLAGNPAANNNVGAGAEAAAANVAAEVGKAKDSAPVLPSAGQVQSQVAGGQQKVGKDLDSADQQVLGHHQKGVADVEAKGAEGAAAHKAQEAARLRKELGDKINHPSVTQFGTESSVAALNAVRDAVGQGVAAKAAQADGLIRGGYEGWKSSVDEHIENYKNNPSASSFAAAVAGILTSNTDGMKGAIEGESAARQLNYDAFMDTQKAEALRQGLSPEQAEYYALARAEVVSKALTAGPFMDTGLDWAGKTDDLREQGYGDGMNPHSTEAAAILKAAETGSGYYLDSVARLNSLEGGHAGELPISSGPSPAAESVARHPIDTSGRGDSGGNAGGLPDFAVGSPASGPSFWDNRSTPAATQHYSPELLKDEGGGPKVTVGPDGTVKKSKD